MHFWYFGPRSHVALDQLSLSLTNIWLQSGIEAGLRRCWSCSVQVEGVHVPSIGAASGSGGPTFPCKGTGHRLGIKLGVVVPFFLGNPDPPLLQVLSNRHASRTLLLDRVSR